MGEFTNISYIQKLFDDYSHEKSFNEELPSDCDVDLFPNQFVYEELIKNKLSHKDNKVIPFLLKFSIDNFISFISFETFTLSLVKKFNCVYHNKSISVSLKTEDNSEILFNGFRLGKAISKRIVVHTAIDNYFYNEKYDKVFIIDQVDIVGVIYKGDIKGVLLLKIVNKMTLYDKIMIAVKVILKYELYNKREMCDIEIRSVFISNNEDVYILMKYFYDDNYDMIKREIIFLLKLLYFLFCSIDNEKDNNEILINSINDSIKHEELNNKLNEIKNSKEYKEKDINDIKRILLGILSSNDNSKDNLFSDDNFSLLSTNIFRPISAYNPNKENNNPILSLIDFDDDNDKISNFFTKYSSKPPHFDNIQQSELSSLTISPLQKDTLSYSKLLSIQKESLKQYLKAEDFFYKNDISSSLKTHKACYDSRNKYLGNKHIDTLTSSLSLADCYFKLGDYSSSLNHLLSSIDIIKSIYTDDNPLCASLYHKIGLVYDLLNQYELALQCYKLSISLKTKYFGKNNLTTANTYYNIAGVYESLNQYTSSLHFYFISLYIYLNINNNKESFDCSTVYSNIALVYDKLGQNEEAIKYYNRAIRIASIYQSLHPLIAICHNNLGLIYFKSLQYNTAIECFKKSISIFNELKALKIPVDVIVAMNNLAAVYFKDEQFVLSHDTYMKCLDEIKNSINNSNETEQATIYNNIGLIEAKWHKYKEAAFYFDNAMTIRKKYFPITNINYYGVVINKATALMKLDKYDEAIALFTFILDTVKDISKDSLIKIYSNIGQCYLHSKDIDNSRSFFLKELSTAQTLYGENKRQTARAYLHMARYYQITKDNVKAKTFLMRCISSAENINNSMNNSMFSSNSNMSLNVSKLKEEIEKIK